MVALGSASNDSVPVVGQREGEEAEDGGGVGETADRGGGAEVEEL